MRRTTFAAVWAVALSAALAAQSQQPSSTPQQPSTSGQTQSQQQGQNQQGQMVTYTGCIYQPSDQPTAFAMKRMSDQAGQTARGGQAGQASGAGQSGQATGTAGSSGASAADADGWYRLTPQANQDLKQYVGRAVRVTGTLVPGNASRSSSQSSSTSITAADLRDAPMLRVQSVTATTGDCAAPTVTPGASSPSGARPGGGAGTGTGTGTGAPGSGGGTGTGTGTGR